MEREDPLYRYIYLEDIDGKKIPSWAFVGTIEAAESCESFAVLEWAKEFGHKVFSMEAPGFFRLIVAAKEITEDDIYEDYGQYLQGRSVVITEEENK